MAKRFVLLVPNQPPETGYTPLEDFRNQDDALAAAHVAAKDQGHGGIAYVNREDTNQCWSVQYHPVPPRFMGLTDKYAPILDWGAEFRVVYDGTEQIIETDEEGHVVSTAMTGDLNVYNETVAVGGEDE